MKIFMIFTLHQL